MFLDDQQFAPFWRMKHKVYGNSDEFLLTSKHVKTKIEIFEALTQNFRLNDFSRIFIQIQTSKRTTDVDCATKKFKISMKEKSSKSHNVAQNSNINNNELRIRERNNFLIVFISIFLWKFLLFHLIFFWFTWWRTEKGGNEEA